MDPKTQIPVTLENASSKIDMINVHNHRVELIKGSSYEAATNNNFKKIAIYH